MATIPTTEFTKEQLFADLKKDGITIDANTINKAKNGDGDTMDSIGWEYHDKKQQYDKAMAWYRLAAAKNNSEAQNGIGALYNDAQGVPVDYFLAMEWYLKAATQNNKYAYGNIGVLFEEGHGVPVDKYKALEWYVKSENQQDSAKELRNQGIKLTQQDKNKSIGQLIMETEEIVWPGRGYIKEHMLKEEEISTFKQKIEKMEEEIQSLGSIKEYKQQELDIKQESIEQYKRKEKAINNEVHLLKQTIKTLELNRETKDNTITSLVNEIKLLRIALENASQGAIKRVKELEKSNGNLEKLLEQEKQLKDNEIRLEKQKTELLPEKKKQAKTELEIENRAIKRESKRAGIATRPRHSPKKGSTKGGTDDENDIHTDYDTEYDSAGSDNNDINYDTPSEEDDENNNVLKHEGGEPKKNKSKTLSA